MVCWDMIQGVGGTRVVSMSAESQAEAGLADMNHVQEQRELQARRICISRNKTESEEISTS